MICVVPLFSIPWNQYFLDANLELGKKWSYEATGVKTTAGGQTMTCSFCVNPNLPMALYVKYYGTPVGWSTPCWRRRASSPRSAPGLELEPGLSLAVASGGPREAGAR